jgi:hypothetical protein
MAIVNALAGVAVRDLEDGIEWYSRALDREPDRRPMSEVAEWILPKGGCLQVFSDPDHAGAASVTLVVADLDEEIRRLTKNGIPAPTPTDATSVRTSIVSDPNGNQVVFAQPLSDAVAH